MDSKDQAAVRRMTVEKFLQIADGWQASQRRIESYRAGIAEEEANQAQLQEQINQCYAAATLFGFDLLTAASTHQFDAGDASQPSPTIPPPSTAAPSNIKDFVLECVQRAYPNPVRAAQLRRQLQELGRAVHEKTIGMTLYRLLKQGFLRREGFDWFYIHETERDEMPVSVTEASLFH
jgi:hypothetical protein